MALGGRREGAGRPFGSRNKQNIRDFFNEKEIKVVVEKMKRMLDDPYVLKFVVEQIFGKAPQSMDITTKGEKIIPILGGATLPNPDVEDEGASTAI